MGKQWKTVTDFIFLGSKITADGDCNHETKTWKKSYDKPRQHIKKQRHYFANKGPSRQSYGFSSSQVWMWEFDYKEVWTLKKWCFWTVVLDKALERPLDCKEIKSVNPNKNQPWIFIGRTDAEAEAPIIWPPMWKADSLEKTLMLGKIEGRRKWGQQRMSSLHGITYSVHMSLSKLQEILKDRDVWCVAVYGVAKKWTWLSFWTTMDLDR